MQSEILFLLSLAYAKGNEKAVETTIEDYPYMAALRFDNVSLCGSVIISENAVLTAAHCIYNMRTYSDKVPSPYFVYVGATKQNSDTHRYEIDKWVTHDKYKDPHAGYDIGIIWIKEGLILGPNIQIAHLNNGKVQLKHGDNAIVVNWSQQNDQRSTNPTLQTTSVAIIENKECQTLLQNNEKIQESVMCASGNNTCESNSSRPLLIGNTVVGLASYSGTCGKSMGHPEIYTRISFYTEWIKERMKETM